MVSVMSQQHDQCRGLMAIEAPLMDIIVDGIRTSFIEWRRHTGKKVMYKEEGSRCTRRIEVYEEDGGIHNNQMKERMEEAYGEEVDVRGRRIEVYV